MEELILPLVKQYPIASSALLAMGALRTIFKPICVAVQHYVDQTESLKDNERWTKIQQSKAFKVVAFVLDYAASIKLVAKEK